MATGAELGMTDMTAETRKRKTLRASERETETSRVDVGLRPRHSPEQLRCEGGGVPNNQNVFIRPELEVYTQNTSEKMRVSARKCMK